MEENVTELKGNNTLETNSANYDEEFAMAGRLTYLKVNLDTLLRNLEIIRRKCAPSTDVIPIVKANAYGHGSVAVTRFLERHDVTHVAVATCGEARDLRDAGVQANIHLLGNVSVEELPTCIQLNLIPTVAKMQVLSEWVELWRESDNDPEQSEKVGQVVIKIDTGLSRNGCQPDDLPRLMDFCEKESVPVHSLMKHFAKAEDDPEFTKQQMDTFMDAVSPYRSKGVKLHVSNTGAIINGVGTHLDFVRAGISIYGQPPEASDFWIKTMDELGIKPSMCWLAKPSLVKDLHEGRVVGYDKTYTCTGIETIATIPLGYADGYLRSMYNRGVLTTTEGIHCPVVGRVSMDGITVRLPESAKHCREFFVIKDDFNPVNSAAAIARKMGTNPYEVCTNLSRRVPRLYVEDGVIHHSLQ